MTTVFLGRAAPALFALLACAHAGADAPPAITEFASYTALVRPPIPARGADGRSVEVIEIEEAVQGDGSARLFRTLRGRCVLLREAARPNEAARTCLYTDPAGDQFTVEHEPGASERLSAYGVRRGRFVAGTGKFRNLTGESAAYPVTIGATPDPAGSHATGRVEFRYPAR